jgi:hypothetical protein
MQLNRVFSNKVLLNIRKKTEIKLWRFPSKNNRNVQDLGETKRKLRILVATNIGGNMNTLAFDTVIARALSTRGHNVRISLCDGGFAACMFAEHQKFKSIGEFVANGMENMCKSCKLDGMTSTNLASVQYVSLRPPSYLKSNSTDDESGIAGTLRFLGTGRKSALIEFMDVKKRFEVASNQYHDAISDLFDSEKFDVIVAHHGIYTPQGVVAQLALERGIPLVTWNQAYRKGRFILSWNGTYHKTLLDEELEYSDLSKEQEEEILNYLESRDAGSNDWIRFNPVTKLASKKIHYDNAKKVFALFTNVSWDAQLHYKSNVFLDMHEWIEKTINWFKHNQDLNLIIRIHPAEINGAVPARDKVFDFIQNLGLLPSNILVIKPEEKVSAYSIMDMADVGIIYGSKAGIELATKGKPVLVAGESWLKNKGIAIEPRSESEYFQNLKDLAEQNLVLPDNFKKRALKLAHYFFCERMIEVKSLKPISRYPYMRPRLKNDWAKKDEGLLAIVRSIEEQKPFVLQEK